METERLTLDLASIEDVTEQYVGWLNDPEANCYLECRQPHPTVESAQRYLAGLMDDRWYFWFIKLRVGTEKIYVDKLIGSITLHINPDHHFGEVAFMIGAKEEWGKGYATEAVEAVTEYGLKKLGLRFIEGGCYGSNGGSRKVFLRNKYFMDGIRDQRFLLDGKPEDHWTYRRNP